jgi:hypothetical protein
VAKVSTGVFKINPGITFDASGYWFVRFEGTGAATAAEDHEAIVDPSHFASDGGLSTRALVSLAETKDWLEHMQIDTSNDLDLVRTINAVSQRLHQEADREFKAITTTSSARTFSAVNGLAATGTIDVGDMAANPSQVRVLADDWTTVVETLSSGDWLNLPEIRQAWQPIRRIQINYRLANPLRWGYRVEVTSTWGFPAVPEDVKQAALDSIAAVYDRDVTHWRQDLAPAQSTPEGGTTIVIGGSQRILSLPPAALATAWSYRDPQA